MRGRSKTLLGYTLTALVFSFGCGERPSRELSFPVFAPRSPFPELATQEKASPPGESGSAFERTLNAASPERPPTQQQPPGQNVPLGNGLLGELPSDTEAWTWSADPGLTLVIHRGPAGLDALIWAEAFSPRMMLSPSTEISRFHREVVPEEVEELLDPEALESLFGRGLGRRIAHGTGLDARQAGRLLQLAMTRTAGLGLGFRSAREGSSGSRWIGRNPKGVVVRLARSSGIWGRQRSFPGELARGLARLGQAAPALNPVAEWLSRAGNGEEQPGTLTGGPAYLLIGSATDEHETVGAHLAVLCRQDPQCPVAAELAAFLGSLQVADMTRLQRLQGSSAGNPADLARSAGLQILPTGALPGPETLNAGEPPTAGPQR
ncbi:MAG TPA: hypothetical protein VLB76_19420 [Thermoanaerobaculia bacterium]|jgi:hypothetical protein|nr:hypothetical protein [Thermoanaerobaculia bacterium]